MPLSIGNVALTSSPLLAFQTCSQVRHLLFNRTCINCEARQEDVTSDYIQGDVGEQRRGTTLNRFIVPIKFVEGVCPDVGSTNCPPRARGTLQVGR